MKKNKKSIIVIALLVIFGISIISCNDKDEMLNTEQEVVLKQKSAFPWWTLIGPISKTISSITDALDGKYHERRIYYPNGKIKSIERWCEGTFGHCTINAKKVNGVSMSKAYQNIGAEVSYTFNSEILNSDIGILYAISKKDTSAIDKFFYSNVITIDHEFL